MKKFVFIYILFFASYYLLYCDDQYEEEEKTIGERIIDKFYDYPKLPENRVTLDLVYGFSNIGLPDGFEGLSIAKTYDLELRYGFTRIDDDMDVDDRFYYASEYAFLANSSSFLKPSFWISTGINIDAWRFGIAYKNGYGYEMQKDQRLTLYHSGMLSWTSIDFELIPVDPYQKGFVNHFDEQVKFGMGYEGGFLFRFYENFNLNLAYEEALVYPYHELFKWSGSALMDLIFHRTVDFFGDDLLKEYPGLYPVMNFLIKNGYSYFVYSFRGDEMNWPFESSPPIVYTHFKLGITVIF